MISDDLDKEIDDGDRRISWGDGVNLDEIRDFMIATVWLTDPLSSAAPPLRPHQAVHCSLIPLRDLISQPTMPSIPVTSAPSFVNPFRAVT